MDVRTATPRPRSSATPGLKTLGRDLRLDACRGFALWFIFLDHIPYNIVSWLTLRNFGFSDATEIFMFISGATCALAYGRAQRRSGWSGAIAHTVRRSWEIYAAFLLLTLTCAVLAYAAGDVQFADESNTRVLLEQPGPTLAHAMMLQYRPVNSDILPVFVVFHLLFAPLLWLLLRAPNAAMAASLLLYALVHVFGWSVPAWPRNDWYFNPLAWQVLFVFGAWWTTGGGKRLWPLLRSRAMPPLAIGYLLFSFVIVMSWHVAALEAIIPRWLTATIYPVDKSDLDLLRLLHFLALAALAARYVPRDWVGFGFPGRTARPENAVDIAAPQPSPAAPVAARLRRSVITPVMRGAIRCGENSLEIYCLSVVLGLAGAIVLVEISGGVAMQIAVSAVGIAVMVAVATSLAWVLNKSKQQPGLF